MLLEACDISWVLDDVVEQFEESRGKDRLGIERIEGRSLTIGSGPGVTHPALVKGE